MKMEYLIPKMDIVRFETEDIITSSPTTLQPGGDLQEGGGPIIDAGDLFP